MTTTQPTKVADLARQLLLLGALETKVKAAKATVADALRDAGFDPGTTLRPLLDDGQPAGSVQHTVPKPKAIVHDPDAFAVWVQSNYPRNVDMVVTVRPAFTDAVLQMSAAAGQPCGPGGEIDDQAPAGIKVGTSAPQVRAVPDRNRAAELWAEIRRDPDGLLALPADPAEPSATERTAQ